MHRYKIGCKIDGSSCTWVLGLRGSIFFGSFCLCCASEGPSEHENFCVTPFGNLCCTSPCAKMTSRVPSILRYNYEKLDPKDMLRIPFTRCSSCQDFQVRSCLQEQEFSHFSSFALLLLRRSMLSPTWFGAGFPGTPAQAAQAQTHSHSPLPAALPACDQARSDPWNPELELKKWNEVGTSLQSVTSKKHRFLHRCITSSQHSEAARPARQVHLLGL